MQAELIDLPLTALSHDADAVSHAMSRIDRLLVVVGHSYGGAVIPDGAGRD